MMKKLGFTLSEVLITLAIIGVIAAITMPALMTNIMNQQVGTSLAKAYNTLENANKLALAENSVRNLDAIPGVGNNYLNLIKRYVAGHDTAAGNYWSYDRSAGFSSGPGYTSNDGITYYSTAGITARNTNVSYCSGRYYVVEVDVNGQNKGPNTRGIDMFIFFVDTRGHVIPRGGELDKEYFGAQAASYLTNCSRGSVASGGMDCAGAIADNNWRVLYR